MRGTTLVTHKEQKSRAHGTNVIYTRNKNIASEEQISSTRVTGILRPSNSSHLRKYCVCGTILVKSGNKIIVPREQIWSTWETKILLWEQIVSSRGTN
jgi:hypothetical protein